MQCYLVVCATHEIVSGTKTKLFKTEAEASAYAESFELMPYDRTIFPVEVPK